MSRPDYSFFDYNKVVYVNLTYCWPVNLIRLTTAHFAALLKQKIIKNLSLRLLYKLYLSSISTNYFSPTTKTYEDIEI